MLTNHLLDCPRFRTGLLSALLLALSLTSVSAQLLFGFGDPATQTPMPEIVLQPNQANQQVALLVRNPEAGSRPVYAMTIEVQIAGGGPEANPPGGSGPHFTTAEFPVGSTFYQKNPSFQGGNTLVGGKSLPQYLLISGDAGDGSVNLASGWNLVATLNLSTATELTGTSWSLGFEPLPPVVVGPSPTYDLLDATFQNSMLSMVPEPGTYSLVFGLGLAAFTMVRRRIRFASR